MASITQAPAELDLAGVAGSPFTVVVDVTLTDEAGGAIPWSQVNDPTVEVVARLAQQPSMVPSIDTSTDDQWTITWSAAQTVSMGNYGKKSLTWALEATIEGVGPVALLAGSLKFQPPTVPDVSTGIETALSVEVGAATASVSIPLYPTFGELDGGGAASIFLPSQEVDGGFSSTTAFPVTVDGGDV